MFVEKIASAVSSAINSINNTKQNSKSQTEQYNAKNTSKSDENEQVAFKPLSDSKAQKGGFLTNILDSIMKFFSSIFGGDNKEEDNKDNSNDNVVVDPQNKYSDFHADFDEMLGYVFDFEGGFANIPEDRGGATNYGITQDTYDGWNERHGLPQQDVQNITKDEAKEIYYQDFYVASGAEEYAKQGNEAYAFAVFDAAVNHGVGAAYDFDKEAQGDVDKFMELRKQFYIDIVANDESQQIFEEGWQNRWNKVYSIIDPNHEYEDYISQG